MLVRDIITKAIENGRNILTEYESKQILKSVGISICETFEILNCEQAVEKAEEIGFPVVMKVSSHIVSHKSDIGGVKLNIKNNDEVVSTYNSLKQLAQAIDPNAKVSIQKMAEDGLEIIIGKTYDSQLGSLIMFGIGGILTELLNDTSFRVIPICKNDAEEMIGETKAAVLLNSYRGGDRLCTEEIVDILMKVSNISEEYPEIKEIDINPIRVYKDKVVCLDARMIMK